MLHGAWRMPVSEYRYDGRVDMDWDKPEGGGPAREMSPPAAYPNGMGVFEGGVAIALGKLAPVIAPPLRVVQIHTAVSVSAVAAFDVGTAFVFDFGTNLAGVTRLSLPAAHGLPRGTALRIEHAEIVAGPFVDTGGMCKVCPKCGPCGKTSECQFAGVGAACNTYCGNPAQSGGADDHQLRQEPCFPHQTYGDGHSIADRYIGDFNDANQTNVYIVRGDGQAEVYTPFFSAAGFRYAQISGLPSSFKHTAALLTALQINSDVQSASEVALPNVNARGNGTPDVLNRIHQMTRASQLSNLWSIPTDCPQRERRGWMGDAQASSDEAMLNFDMQRFYEGFLQNIKDDQERYDENHAGDTGALADVVPYDGIGGNPGCPVWQVAYIVLSHNIWKHYGMSALPTLRKHYSGLTELMGWFARHADSDGLLATACYGDWMGFNPGSANQGSSSLTPKDSVTAFYHVLASGYMATIAAAIGEKSDAAAWAQKHENLQRAYHKRFYDASAGGYSPCDNQHTACYNTSARGSQTSNAMALAVGAPPDVETATLVAASLASDVQQLGDKTTAGVVGMAFVFPMLDQHGFGDRALSILSDDAYPSFGYMASQNMTTLCENLACSFHDSGGSSLNHIMLGGFDAWVHTSLGGLDSAVNGTTGGWKHILARVSPGAITALGQGSVSHRTPFGSASLTWKFAASSFTMNLSVPVGSTAEVHSPMALGSVGRLVLVTEGAGAVWDASAEPTTLPVGTLATEQRERAMVVVVGSGKYAFSAFYSTGAPVS
jgi:alpha-L-rhamnosidase